MNPEWRAQVQSADEQYEAILRDEQNRETSRLASQIVDKLDPEASISPLEKIGPEKLRQIVEWLNGVSDRTSV